MIGSSPQADPNERRWRRGSYIAAGFALFLFLYNLITALVSLTWPTDGWTVNINGEVEPASSKLEDYFLSEETPLQAGDLVVAINGVSIDQLLDEQHKFFAMQPPDWPDGTLLTYTLLRAGNFQTVQVPVRTASFLEYLSLYTRLGPSQFIQAAGGIFFFVVSLIVFFLRPGNRAAHALLFIGVTFFFGGMVANFTTPTLFYPNTPASIPFDGWTLGINPGLMYLALVFPYPKAFMRKYSTLVVALIFASWPLAFNTAYLLNLDDRLAYKEIAFRIYPIQIVALMLITAVSLVHSFLKVRDPVGRSQLKWMVAGVFSFVFLGVGGWFVSAYLFPSTMSAGNWLTTTIGWFLLPLCLAIGITRYRLFDIDVIIRKTLVYSLLSGLLALVFFGSVTLLQQVFGRLSGTENSPIAIVLSTLAIAALFTSLRVRVQDFIDRRFYRQKYNAEQALAEFALTARSENDLVQLSSRLTATVQDTLQPEAVSLWIKSNPVHPSGPSS
jgi:hypothetical protein